MHELALLFGVLYAYMTVAFLCAVYFDLPINVER
ncbi:MAG: hypothetical protein RLZZ413_3385 [Pseudomonadota bacterium]|jgi:hypothetical protein